MWHVIQTVGDVAEALLAVVIVGLLVMGGFGLGRDDSGQ